MIFKLLILFLFLIFFKVFTFKENLKTIDVALCVVAKNENLYIKEFVEYYKNIGIIKDKFIIIFWFKSFSWISKDMLINMYNIGIW